MNIDLNYEVHNPKVKGTAIVMVHGLQSSLRTFDSLIKTLPDNWKIITVDQRGHGKSPVYGDSYSSEKMAQDLKILVQKLQLKRFHLLGHSMGGRTALAYAGLYPNDLNSIIVEDMGMEKRSSFDSKKLKAFQRTYKNWQGHPLIFPTKKVILDALRPMFSYADGLVESKVIELPDGQFQLEFNPGVAGLYGYEGNITDLSFGLTETDIPAVFFVADPKVGSAMTNKSREYIKNLVPRAKEVYFPGAWHNIHKSQTEKFSKELILWIEN